MTSLRLNASIEGLVTQRKMLYSCYDLLKYKDKIGKEKRHMGQHLEETTP